MLEIKNYKNLENALSQILKKDKEYNIIKHDFSKGHVVKEHFHPNVGEWVIFDSGNFEVEIDFEKYSVQKPEKTAAIYFPKGYIHKLKCLENISYVVLRERKDETIYLKDVLKKRFSVKPIEDTCGILWELYSCDNLSLAYDKVIGTAGKHKHVKMQEIYRVEKGEGELAIGDQVLQIKKGDIIPIPKHTFHYLKKVENKELEVLVLTHPKFDPKDVILEK